MIDLSEWWKHDFKDVMAQIYWFRDQIPPKDPEAWETVREALTEKYGDGNE